ncbi:tryptophan aminotransferase-related protein 3-like isoform X1 [Rhododendron vialii]|uniref:tryptophan aminotransferase-related protein 3-like isoform X1 n=1 Tax=Rhododendron vialii TaxID=182163 RepID=UPI00265FEE80|nr:tryptophan aminotransferase-related protein 3-like isoform X1 [Rhododendron vialii]
MIRNLSGLIMGRKFQSSKFYGVCLLLSVALNLYFFINLHLIRGKWNNNDQLSWSQKAEAVAAVSCSGHGSAYLDGLFVDGKPSCECNSCFGGPDCSQFPPDDCVADADGGDPLFLEPFWMQHAASSALVVAGWHRMSYVFENNSHISHELEKHIRRVHSIAKNAATSGKYIVFGAGSTQLLNAAVYALSPQNSSSPAKVVASIPYYPIYETQTGFVNSVNFEFEGDASLWKNSTSDSSINVIEFVTAPNNPDGKLNKPTLQGPSVKTIHDLAYFWPHFTAIPAPADEDLMIFTISKLTGHAGSRFGWAVVKDEAVYQRIVWYMILSEMGVSRDAQLRALKLLKVVLEEGEGNEIFEFAYQTMRKRWERLSRVISMSNRFSIQEIPPQFCTFFQKVRGPSPEIPVRILHISKQLYLQNAAYAWLKCEWEEDKDCSAVLRGANILSRNGSMFAARNRYVRLSLIRTDDDFEFLLHRMNNLVSDEDGSKTM